MTMNTLVLAAFLSSLGPSIKRNHRLSSSSCHRHRCRRYHCTFLQPTTTAATTFSQLQMTDASQNTARAGVGTGDDSGVSSRKRPRPRKNRPGMNSYLKVLLPENLVQEMHEKTVKIQEMLSASSKEKQDNQQQDPSLSTFNTELSGNEESINNNNQMKEKQHLRIRARSLDSLHMTLFFGGEVLANELSADDLHTWYNRVRRRLAESDFGVVVRPTRTTDSSNTNERTRNQSDEKGGQQQQQQHDQHDNNRKDKDSSSSSPLWFRFSHFRTFPPRRNYLVVAIFEASPAWHTLYNDIRSLSKGDIPALEKITQHSSKEDKFVPHVTVANLQNGSSAQKKDLRALLQSLSSEVPSDVKHVATGIGMGGPILPQVEVDWNFEYHLPQNSSTGSEMQEQRQSDPEKSTGR